MTRTTDSLQTHYFIDLAKLGRTDWRACALTILLIASISIFSTLSVLAFASWSLYFKNFHIVDAVKSVFFAAANPICGILGFWLACRMILRRPFLSLVSADLRFSYRRCLLGAALFLPALMFSLIASALFVSMLVGSWTIPYGHLQLPQMGLNVGQIVWALVVGIGIAFCAFAEELFFRGWLTQTLGQYVRSPTFVVVIVAVIFAAYHTQYDLHGKALVFFCSLGFSALSLRDQRLELAIGAHSMMNICAMLMPAFLTGSHTHGSVITHSLGLEFDAYVFVVLKGVLPFALMYYFLQMTGGWFKSSPAARTRGSSASLEAP
jgi:uncharacterized protein